MGKTIDFISGGGVTLSGVGSTETEKKVTITAAYIGELYHMLVIRPGFVWANGQVLTGATANYPLLKAWLKDTGQYGGAWLRKTLDEWNAEWNDAKWNAPDTTGNRAGMSPFYVLDEGEDTIKVPDLRGAYLAAAGFSGQTSGMTLNDAIRNITGAFVSLGTTSAANHGVIHIDITPATDAMFASGQSSLAWLWNTLRADYNVPTALTNRPRSIASYLCLYAAGPAA
jgi:hypothetical protein